MELLRLFYRISITILNSLLMNIRYIIGNKEVRLSQTRRNIIILGIPHHQNIGDQAIVLAEQHFVLKHFPNDHIVLIPEVGLESYLKSVRKQLKSTDLVMYHGGGNLGSLYPYAERRRRFSLSKFRDYKFVLFPQSVFFENTFKGKFEKFLCQRAYQRVEKLVMVVRENVSLRRAEKTFPKREIVLVPDIVLSLLDSIDCSDSRLPFEKALTVLRSDRESGIDGSLKTDLSNYLKDRFKTASVTDTMAEGDLEINSSNRDRIVKNKWQQFRENDVIITDRLHGTLFAILNRRPCVVFDNTNHKVESTISTWLNHYDGLVIVNEKSVKAVESAIQKLEESDINFELNLYDEFKPLIAKMK